MGTTVETIKGWIETGKELGATHLLVACDTWDYADYPLFVKEGGDAREIYNNRHGHNMQKIMEVYNLSMDIEKQLSEHRSMNF